MKNKSSYPICRLLVECYIHTSIFCLWHATLTVQIFAPSKTKLNCKLHTNGLPQRSKQGIMMQMLANIPYAELVSAALNHIGSDLPRHTAERHNVSPEAAQRYLPPKPGPKVHRNLGDQLGQLGHSLNSAKS